MKLFGKIGMFLAVSILMMHSLMPHQHHNQIADDERHAIEHSQADSLLDYILLAFHVNPGENHLEEFEKASSISLLYISAELGDYQFICPQETVEQSSWMEYEYVFTQQFLPSQLSFRGPPQLV